jgi:hypothetical protein
VKTQIPVLTTLVFVVAGCAAPLGSASPSLGAGSTQATAAGPSGLSSDTAPVGSWTMTLTAEDLVAAGFTDVGAIEENTGTFTHTFASDGTWTVAQVTTHPIRWPVFRGTYTVTGDRTIEMRTEFPPDYAGDVVTVAWTRDAEGLRLRLLTPPDPLLRINLETHPWAPSP